MISVYEKTWIDIIHFSIYSDFRNIAYSIKRIRYNKKFYNIFRLGIKIASESFIDSSDNLDDIV